jgi:hypothetical protein
MEEFRVFYNELLGPKYYSIENDDGSISFIPMTREARQQSWSQKDPTYKACYIPKNMCKVYENVSGDYLILEHIYVYLEDRWQKMKIIDKKGKY